MLIMQTKLTYKTFYKLLIYVTIIIFYYIHMNRLIFLKITIVTLNYSYVTIHHINITTISYLLF